MRTTRIGSFVLLAALAMLAAAVCGASANTVVVYPGDMDGWAIASRQGTAANPPVAEMVDGVGTPPSGSGSLQMLNHYSDTDPLSKIYAGTNNHSGTALADITSLKVWTYVSSRTYPVGQPPMIELITDSGASTQQRVFWFYPWGKSGNQNVQLNTWQEWDLMSPNGYWELLQTSSSNYFGNWDWVVNRYAGAKLATPQVGDYADGYKVIGGVNYLCNETGTSLSIKIGAGKAVDSRYGAWWQTSASISAWADMLTIGVSGVETVYDFEMVPEPGSIAALAVGLVGLVGLRRRSR